MMPAFTSEPPPLSDGGSAGAGPLISLLEAIRTIQPRQSTLAAGSIPIEIILEILPKLARADLARVLRVSRAVHLATLPFLYTELTIDLGREINPITSRGVAIKQVKPTEPSSSSSKCLSLPNRFSYTKHLTIVTHDRVVCATLPSPVMPNLITLRVKPTGCEDHLDLCTSSTRVLDFPPYLPTTDHIPCCALVASLHPRRLILGDCTTGLTGSAKGLWPSSRSTAPSPSFPTSIREFIILVGMATGIEDYYRPSSSFLDHPPETVEKVTFVQSCGHEGWEKLCDRDGDIHPLDNPDAVGLAMMKRVAKLRCDIEIVQVLDVDEDGRVYEEEDIVRTQRWLRALLEKLLLGENGHLASRAKKAEVAKMPKAVKSVDDHGFRKREPWYPAVVAASLEMAMDKVVERAV